MVGNTSEQLQTDFGRIPLLERVPLRNIRLNEKQRIMITTLKNKVQLLGHLGADPELKEVSGGHRLVRLNLATNERYKTMEGDWKEDIQWHPVVAWGKQAERLAELVRKGSGLIVEGRLVHRRYETKDGEKRSATEVVLSDFQLLGARGEKTPG